MPNHSNETGDGGNMLGPILLILNSVLLGILLNAILKAIGWLN